MSQKVKTLKIKTIANDAENIIENKKSIEIKNAIILAKQKKTILTGIVEKSEINLNLKGGAKYSAVVSYKGYKVIIPIAEMGFELSDPIRSEVEAENEKRYKSYLTGMLGAEIDFVFIEVDAVSKICVGSRKIAMLRKRVAYYYGNEDALSPMQDAQTNGYNVEGRITSVTANSLRVEVFGVETNIIPNEIGYRYASMSYIGQKYCVGTRTKMKIKNMDVDKESGNISLQVSIKDTYENPVVENIKKYNVGDEVMGVITNVTPKAYFVSVGDYDTGIDVYCARVSTLELPTIGDVVAVQIGGISEAESRAYGNIKKIIKRSA